MADDLKPKECSKCGATFPTDPEASAAERDAEYKAHMQAFHPGA